MEAARQYSVAENPDNPKYQTEDEHFSLMWAKNVNPVLSIPITYRFDVNCESVPSLPNEIGQQIVGQIAKAGIAVNYHGKQYVVMYAEWNLGCPEIGSEIRIAPEVLYLAEATFVALDK